MPGCVKELVVFRTARVQYTEAGCAPGGPDLLTRMFSRLAGAVRPIAHLLLVCASLSCTGEPPVGEATGTIRVFAAASTTDVMSRLAEMYESRTGTRVQCNFAASSMLARQIEAGAPADLFLSANPVWMDRLERNGKIETDTRRDLLANSLVLIAPAGRRFDLEMQPQAPFGTTFDGRLALGDPAHVPAGKYAREALESLGWWSAVENRLIPAMDVRDALRIVALGEAGAGIVYSTDAKASENVVVIGTFLDESHAAIRYPVGRIRDASKQAEGFLDFLFSDTAAAVFESAGFRRADPA